METTLELGTSIATPLTAANALNQQAPQVKTLSDLLAAMHDHPCYLMQRRTADLISGMVGLPREEIPIDDLLHIKRRFKCYLRDRHFSRSSIRTHLYLAMSFLTHARKFGWAPTQPEFPDAWKEIVPALPRGGCRAIVSYAVELNKKPDEFTEDDLRQYAQVSVESGKSYATAMRHIRTFRCVLSDSGLTSKFPQLTCAKHAQFGVPLSLFPPQLQEEVKHVLKAKQAKFIPRSLVRLWCSHILRLGGVSYLTNSYCKPDAPVLSTPARKEPTAAQAEVSRVRADVGIARRPGAVTAQQRSITPEPSKPEDCDWRWHLAVSKSILGMFPEPRGPLEKWSVELTESSARL
jgi:hypothetical protein